MANEGVTESQASTVGEVERAILAAEDPGTGDLNPILGDQGVLRVNLVTEGGERLTDALDSVGQDALRVVPPNQLDVDLAAQSLSPITVTDDGNLAVASLPEPLDVSASEVDVDIATQSLSPLTVTDDGSLAIAAYNGGTLPTEQQTPVGVEDGSGTQVDPAEATDFPNSSLVGQDLTGGDATIGPVPVAKSQSLVVAINETSAGSLDVTISWQDTNGNVFQEQTPTDLALSGVTEDWARVVRKGPEALITLSNSNAATSTNAYADTHR